MSELSMQALAALKVWFGFSEGQTLTFNTPSRRTSECVAVLDELVGAGYITCTPRNSLNGSPLDYTAEPHTYDFVRKINQADAKSGGFQILKDFPDEDET